MEFLLQSNLSLASFSHLKHKQNDVQVIHASSQTVQHDDTGKAVAGLRDMRNDIHGLPVAVRLKHRQLLPPEAHVE